MSKEFGAIFDDFEKEKEALLVKLEQRIKPTMESINNNQLVPKEVRNLISELKYKGGEPRSQLRKGRRPYIGDQ